MKKFRTACFLLIAALLCGAVCGCAADRSEVPESSSTNVQVNGIDEADIVKLLPGGYIIKLQSDGITVSKAKSGLVTVLKKNPIVDYSPRKMFVCGNVLVAIGGITRVYIYEPEDDYYYSDGWLYAAQTEIRLYDITEPESGGEDLPMLRSILVRGDYAASRLYLGKLYVQTILNSEQTLGYDIKDSLTGNKKLAAYAPRGNSGDYEYRRGSDYYNGGAILVCLNLNHYTAEYKATFYDCLIKDMYFSEQGIFFIAGYYERVWELFFLFFPRNTIYFSNYIFSADAETLQIKAVSAGLRSPNWGNAIADRFSLHAAENHLFVVTREKDRSFSVRAYGLDLKLISKLDGVARNETLHGVTFEDGYCYFVTYRNVDPLFKVDISDPKNIKLVGELKIPGFSEYLKPFSCYMLGLGYTDGRQVKVSLFDISGDEPVEINNVVIVNFSYVEAINNPKAILVNEPNNIFGFSVGNSYYVFGIEDGRLSVRKKLDTDGSASSRIVRAVTISGYFYALSDSAIESYALPEFGFVDAFSVKINV